MRMVSCGCRLTKAPYMDPVITMRAIKWVCATMASWCGAGSTEKSNHRLYHRNCAHRAVIRVCDDAGNVIETHEYKGDFKSGELSYAKCLDSFDAL